MKVHVVYRRHLRLLRKRLVGDYLQKRYRAVAGEERPIE